MDLGGNTRKEVGRVLRVYLVYTLIILHETSDVMQLDFRFRRKCENGKKICVIKSYVSKEALYVRIQS